MVVEWAKECVVSQMMACIINNSVRWRRSYMVLREYHNEGMFGEKSISELTDPQLEILNLSQLYDVVHMAVDQYYGEDDDGVAREVPEDVLPYPGLLVKWYDNWKKEGKKVRDKPKDKDWSSANPSKEKKTVRKVKPTTVFVDNESNAKAFTAWQRAKKKK